MALPQLEVNNYKLTLPKSKRVVKYRPFLVKEEKILMIAKQDDDEDNMMMAVKQIIENCTFQQVKVEKLEIIDLEFIFLHIRMKSRGETSLFNITCPDVKCGHKTEHTLDLNEYTISNMDVEDVIMLSDDIGMKMQNPTLEMALAKDQTMDSMLKGCVQSIFQGDDVTMVDSVTPEEFTTFLESFTQKQLDEVHTFIKNLPAISYNLEANCEACGKSLDTTIEGLHNFL